MSAADAAGLKAGKDYPGPWPDLLPFVALLVVARSVSRCVSFCQEVTK